MKKFLPCILIFLALFSARVVAQSCTIADATTATRISASSYPYTSPATGITVSARKSGGVVSTTPYTYSCSGTSYTTPTGSWGIGTASTDSIILTFSHKVTNFSFIINVSNPSEIVTVTAASGAVSLSNYCAAGYGLVPATTNRLETITSAIVGTFVTADNPAGAYVYYITHNGIGSACTFELLDCIASTKGPADIVEGIQLWLDGSNVNNNPGTNPADATKLAVWKDISGMGNDAKVLSGQDTAKMHKNQINGKDVMQFTGVSQFYGSIYEVPNVDIRASAMPQSTIFTVYRPTTPTGSIQGIWGDDNGGWDRFFMPSFGGADGVVAVGPPINNVLVPGAGTAGETKLLTAVYHSGVTDSSVIYFNALPLARVTDNTHATDAQTRLRIGWDGDDNPFTGDIAEMVVYNRKLTECEIKAVNRYFGYKYGVSFTSATVNPSTQQYMCAGDTVSLKGRGGSTFQWLKDGVLLTAATDSVYKATAPGNYAVIASHGGCSDTSVATLVTLVPSTIYVDSSIAVSGNGGSWATAKKTVGGSADPGSYSELPNSHMGQKGTYYPTANTNRDSSFRITRNNIKLYGGFAGGETLLSARSVTANPTILSGDIGTANDSTDNSYHVMTIQAKATAQIDTNTVVDGFIITRGNAQSAGSFTHNGITYNRQDGGGIHIWGANSGNKCTPIIAHCTLTRNTANFGGGIYNAGFNSGANCSPVFRNNTFSYNKANTSGGGLFNNGQNSGLSSPSFDSCMFSFNTSANGGGVYNQASGGGTSNSTFSNSTFNNNKATADGAGFFNSYGKPLISNCRFYQNDAAFSGGACFQQGGKATFNLNIFDQNTAQIAGAIRTNTGDPSVTIFRNVFYRNTSSINDAGALSLVCGNGNDTVINNLFVQNKTFGSGPNGGGAMVQEGGTSSYIINNTFYADSSAGSGGAVHFKAGGTNRTLVNNIFYKCYNGSSVSDYNTASGTSVTTESNNLFSSTNPRFVKESNPIGADGTWLTADDGLDLLPCSPAINAGTTAPPADIRNRARLGLPDIGAYEEQGKPLPAAPVATSPVSYCQNATSVALTAATLFASDTLKWYNAVPALLTGAPTPSTATAGTFTWYVSRTDSTGCESAKTTINVVIKPTPVAPVATTPVIYCQGITATALTATLATAGDTLKWYDAAMAPLAAAPIPSTTTPGTVIYYVSEKTGLNCEGPKTMITVQVNPTPALPTTTTPVTYCQNATAVALTATAASANDTLRWYNSVPTLLSAAPIPSTATAGTFTFYVSQKNNFSCEGAKKAITVQINPTPVAPTSTSPVTYCQEDVAVALTASKASSTDTLKWYDAALVLLSGAPIPSTVSPGTTIYYVSAKTAIGCEGPKTTINVVVNPRPLAPTVVTPINLCVGVAPAPLTATGTNLKWYTAASGGTGMATLKPNVSSAGANTYYVSQTNTFSCESPKASLTVNVRPSPVVTVAPVDMPTFVFCVGDSVTIKASSATAISYEWKTGSSTIPGSVSDTLHINTTATYTVIVKDSYGCADTESVYVMKNPLPKPKLFPVDVRICKGVNIILYGSPASTGYKYEWFKDGNLMGIDTSKDQITVDSTGFYMVRMTDIYTCTVNSNGSNVSQYPEMIKPSVVRTGSVLKLSATYASYQWYRNGKIITGATSRTYTLSFDGDYHVVVLDANGCEGSSEVIPVHALGINPAQAQGDIRVYPNPTQGKVTIDAGAKVNVIVTDITGRELLRAQQTTEVNLEPFADGVYMLRIFDLEGRLIQNQRLNKQTK